MRKVLFILLFVSFAGCNSNQETKVQSMTSKDSSTVQKIAYPPYDNSVNFEMGDGSVIPGMLEVYKGWEENDLAKMKKHFADTVIIRGCDGMVFHGSRDAYFAEVRTYRNNYKTMKPAYHAFANMKSLDKDQNWFVVWYKEYQTDIKGKLDSVELLENWALNKDGKVTALYQYIQHNPAPPKK